MEDDLNEVISRLTQHSPNSNPDSNHDDQDGNTSIPSLSQEAFKAQVEVMDRFSIRLWPRIVASEDFTLTSVSRSLSLVCTSLSNMVIQALATAVEAKNGGYDCEGVLELVSRMVEIASRLLDEVGSKVKSKNISVILVCNSFAGLTD